MSHGSAGAVAAHEVTAPTIPWIDITLAVQWDGNLQRYKDGNTVYLQGTITSRSSASALQEIFGVSTPALPSDWRPSSNRNVSGKRNGSAFTTVASARSGGALLHTSSTTVGTVLEFVYPNSKFTR